MPISLDPSDWTHLVGLVYLDPSIWTHLFGPVCLDLSISIGLFSGTHLTHIVSKWKKDNSLGGADIINEVVDLIVLLLPRL